MKYKVGYYEVIEADSPKEAKEAFLDSLELGSPPDREVEVEEIILD